MTTINDVTFNMKTLEPVGTHRNVPNEEIGTDESFITDMGYTGLVMRMTGYEKTLAKYDEVINEFMKPGAHTLVYRTGWQFTVYSTQYVPMLDVGIVDNFFPYELVMLTSNPYRESTSETTRPKTITTNNQEWSADNSANDIDTDGSVDAIPDIQITGGAPAATLNRTYSIEDGEFDATEVTDDDTTYSLKKTMTFTAKAGIAYFIDYISARLRIDTIGGNAMASIRVQAASLYSGVETEICSMSHGLTGYETQECSPDIMAAVNEQVVITWYLKCSISGRTAYMEDLNVDLVHYRKDIALNPSVYNTANSTVKSNVANEILKDAVHRINTDGTGTIEYADNFSSDKYEDAFCDLVGVTHDTGNAELDFVDDGYLSYKIDTKYPITGIPTLSAYIDIISGTPTLQISSDGSTWYNITTSIVDAVTTVYDLDSASLSLKGLTGFYWRLDCTDTGTHTCSLKIFTLNIVFTTIDVEHPKVTAAGVSTFRCDQHADSGLNCTVALVYRDRSWVA